ncbi:hypothetical protein [Halomonas litopenaei]|uniref:hypothetical protein n=1 Tax=Halomonas litopenaei TaxID=2109328 RepID=UPI001A8F3E51|nr:hypothetical protein [Halomonas litopenaei]MBN8411127.1 hypothetical protein [Halomonas litopenaei]
MLRSHEQSIIDSFFDYFKMVVEDRGENLTRFSTDGQDSILGGDYIFTNSTKFVLTEFKYKEKGIKLEGKKERMLTLCIELDKD